MAETWPFEKCEALVSSFERDCALDLAGDDMVKLTAVGADDLAPTGAPADENEIEITPEMIA
jgi:hypothetical protein